MAKRAARFIRLLPHVLLLRPLVHLVFGINVRGGENIPRRGPFVLAANHNSHLDILILYAALPVRLLSRVHVLAAFDYFSKNRPLFAVVDRLFQPVWVDRESGAGDALKKAAALLAAGEIVILFPEGTRGTAGQIGPFHGGVGRLISSRPATPLLPVFLRGPERALPRESAFPLPLWQHVTIGPPRQIASGPGQITDALRESIAALERSETASRHKRPSERRRAPVIAILGIDGSGKSTLAGRLAIELSKEGRSCLIGDRFEVFASGAACPAEPLLKEKVRRWMSTLAKDARSLARYRIPKLTELLLRDAILGEAKRWYGPDWIVMDGSPILNMTAWSALYRPELMSDRFCRSALSILSRKAVNGDEEKALLAEFRELRVMKRLGLARLRLPDVALFLDVDPAVAMERIERRGERKQVHETEEKLRKLRNAYLHVIGGLRKIGEVRSFVLRGNRGLDSIVNEALESIRKAAAEARDPEAYGHE